MEIFEKARILLVDDKPANLLALQVALERLGHTLVPAGSGEEALRCLMKQDFAVILLDVQMPEMDGFEIATLVRAQISTRYSPIIFLTAIGKTDAEMSRGYEVGAMDYLHKPYNAEILRSKVKILVELHQNTAAIRRRNAVLEGANARMKLRMDDHTTALRECGKNLARANSELAGKRGGAPA